MKMSINKLWMKKKTTKTSIDTVSNTEQTECYINPESCFIPPTGNTKHQTLHEKKTNIFVC